MKNKIFVVPALFVIECETQEEAQRIASDMQDDANRGALVRNSCLLDETLKDKTMEIDYAEEEIPFSYSDERLTLVK